MVSLSVRTEQEVPIKLTQNIVVSFVSAVFDPFCMCSIFKVRMRFLLNSIWKAMKQNWNKNLSKDHSELFFDWCSVITKDNFDKPNLF